MNHHFKQLRILTFWFGEDPLKPFENSKIWFTRSRETDMLTRELFGEMWEDASTGAFDDWVKTPDGALALIVLCDQLSRNMFRGEETAFSQDARALKAAQIAIAHGFENFYSPIQRIFLYLPFEHSEDLEMQKRSVERFSTLLESTADPTERRFIAAALDYAERHKNIIEKFGRFPHRNVILGRANSRAEEEFLKHTSSSGAFYNY